MLLVNADDGGIAKNIDAGILELIQAGKVNSVSLVGCGKTIKEFVGQIKGTTVREGIHLTLVGESGKVMTAMPASFKEFLILFFTGRLALETIRKELESQILSLRELGVQLTHADSHQHLHILPGIAEIVVKLCVKYKIPRVRLINEGLNFNLKVIPLVVMRIFSARLQRLCRKSGLTCADYFYGFNCSMAVNPQLIATAKNKSSSFLVELMCHPGNNPKSSEANPYPHWQMDWAREKQTLLQCL